MDLSPISERSGKVAEAAEALRNRLPFLPEVGIVLGSGLGGFAEELTGATVVGYEKIPHWPQSTAVGHAGKLVAGYLEGTPVVVLAGRAHLYEGYSTFQATFGVRVLHALGVKKMVFTNAAGGISVRYGQGSLVVLSDHINLQGVNPLAGPNDDELGPRFPDMSEAYDRAYRQMAQECAREIGFALPDGVYAGLLGPSYETPAEIRYLRAIGADLVGMSTVPEVIFANWVGMRVLAISCVTNMAAGVLDQKINHEEVLETGRMVRARFTKLLRKVIPKL